VTVENEDGTTTETMTVNFTNEKQGITRENIISKTSKDGKIIMVDHSLKTTTKAYTRTATRLVTIAEDGTRTVKTQSTTEWKTGQKMERVEERIVAADGSATGSGTMTITSKDGTVKTYNISVNVTASGE